MKITTIGKKKSQFTYCAGNIVYRRRTCLNIKSSTVGNQKALNREEKQSNSLMRSSALNSFLLNYPNQSSIKRNHSQSSPRCVLSSSQFFSGKLRTSFRNPALGTEKSKPQHKYATEMGIKRFSYI